MKSEQNDQDNNLEKFISLMKSLTKFIKQDFSHQHTIYQCLNSQQLKRLFDSIHDECWQLRMTSIKFISYLLYNNRKIIEILCTMQGYDYCDHKKYIIGGLNYYFKNGYDIKGNIRLKQTAIIQTLAKVKYQPQILAWAIDIKTFKIAYYVKDSIQQFGFDPKTCVVGIFVKEEEKQKKSVVDKNKYKISKR